MVFWLLCLSINLLIFDIALFIAFKKQLKIRKKKSVYSLGKEKK